MLEVEISLTRGMVTVIDAEDLGAIAGPSWHVLERDDGKYGAKCSFRVNGKSTGMKMHRAIMGDTGGLDIDHIDGDPLNNRRSNLRVATRSQNCMNSKSHENASSEHKGVSWDRVNKKWRAQICVDGVNKNLGRFSDEIQAAKEYDRAAIKLHGEFARLNFL